MPDPGSVAGSLRVNNTVLVVIDVQTRLARVMHEHEETLANIERMVKIAKVLDIPVLRTEQAPEKIGSTVDTIAKLLPSTVVFSKSTFSCYRQDAFREALKAMSRRQLLLVGIEAHVCVYQTARDLKRHGYDVYVAADAVSSRSRVGRDIGLQRMQQEGIHLTTVEMASFEFLGSADHPKFKDVLSIVTR
jgi:nicotinamidase-related amidase